MTEQEDRHTRSIKLANQMINIANDCLEAGMSAEDIAAGMRHAAANFTAFSVAGSERPDTVDTGFFAEEFLEIYTYYFEKHMQGRKPVSGLDALVSQVKKES